MVKDNVTRVTDGELAFIKYVRSEMKQDDFLFQVVNEALLAAIRSNCEDIEHFSRYPTLVKEAESKNDVLEEFRTHFLGILKSCRSGETRTQA